MQRLNGLDAGFLFGETPEWHMHVGGLVVLDSPGWDRPPLEMIRELLRARLHLLGPFRQRLVPSPLLVGRPVWVDTPDLDLEAHVRGLRVPSPGDATRLAALLDDLMRDQLDRSRPLWEAWVLEGLADDRVALFMKIHHSLTDGVRGARLYEAIFDLDPAAPVARKGTLDGVVPDGQTGTGVSPVEIATGALAMLASTPRRLARLAAESMRTAGRMGRFVRSSEARAATWPFRAPRTPFNGRLTPRRALAFGSIPFADVQTLRRGLHVTVNDVILAVTAGALRAYLLERDALPERSLVAEIPVGVHRDQPADRGNFVASTGASLHTDIADPIERLLAVHASASSAKALQSALGDDLVVEGLALVPPRVLRLGVGAYRTLQLDRLHPPIFNTIVSNVPGAPVALHVLGARVAGIHMFGPLLVDCGLNITFSSTLGQLDVGITACPELIEDPWAIASGLLAALAELRDALTARVA
jgi:WS/DGAT/MGAT family acyltransferase